MERKCKNAVLEQRFHSINRKADVEVRRWRMYYSTQAENCRCRVHIEFEAKGYLDLLECYRMYLTERANS